MCRYFSGIFSMNIWEKVKRPPTVTLDYVYQGFLNILVLALILGTKGPVEVMLLNLQWRLVTKEYNHSVNTDILHYTVL